MFTTGAVLGCECSPKTAVKC